jgi:hypothetical protein
MSQVDVPFKMFGLQRTGTNLMRLLMLKNFHVHSAERGGEWKHGPASKELQRQWNGLPMHFVLCVKTPYAWIFSCYRYFCRSAGSDRTVAPQFRKQRDMTFEQFVYSPTYEFENPVDRWNRMYQHWLQVLPKDRTLVVRQEDQLEQQETVLTRAAKEFQLAPKANPFIVMDHHIGVDMRVGGSMDRSFYMKRQYLDAYSNLTLDFVNDRLNWHLMEKFNYEREQQSATIVAPRSTLSGTDAVNAGKQLEVKNTTDPGRKHGELEMRDHSQHELDSIKQLLADEWLYRRVGYDERRMAFNRDGTIGTGRAEQEQHWSIRRDGSHFELTISSQRAVTCRLRSEHGLRWVGQWDRFERMPIVLYRSPRTIIAAHSENCADNGVNQFIGEFFSDSLDGFVVAFGASKCALNGPTQTLIERGWSGILFEPIPEMFWRLQDRYADLDRVRLINSGISTHNGYGTIWIGSTGGLNLQHGGPGQLRDNNGAENSRELARTHYIQREIRLMCADDVLHRVNSSSIEFWNIDLEVCDIQIVKYLLEKGLKPTLMVCREPSEGGQLERVDAMFPNGLYREAFRGRHCAGWLYEPAKIT